MARPKLIVFDLDYTLWPFWVDTHYAPPFHIDPCGVVRDGRNRAVPHYPDVPHMLQRLCNDGYTLGVASRTSCTEEACILLGLFDWKKYFKYHEIYPGDKTTHFNRFHSLSGIPFKDMIFFDDEMRNVRDVSKLGVTCIHAHDGMSFQVLDEGFRAFHARFNQPRSR